jgi:hypothetical protein
VQAQPCTRKQKTSFCGLEHALSELGIAPPRSVSSVFRKRKSLVRPSLRRNRADGSTPPHDAIRTNQQTFAPEVVGAKLQDKNEFEVDDRLVPAAARTNIQQLPDNAAGCLVPRSHIPSMRAFRMHPQDPPPGVLGCPDEGTACCTQRQPSITNPAPFGFASGWLT